MRSNFRPTLETLESRWVPTVTASITNGVAYFKGDSGNDTVNIVASTDADTGDYLLTATYNTNNKGSTTSVTINLTETPLTGAWVQLNKGNDNFTFDNTNGFDISQSFSLAVGLGDGNNKANILMDKNITGDGTLVDLNVATGNGRDTINVEFFGNIDEGATIKARLDGGKGNDTITVQHDGVVQGSVNFLVYGGGGLDLVHTSFYAEAPADAGATGSVNVAITGSKDKNTLVLLASQAQDASVNASLKIYGFSTDTAYYTDGVFVYGLKSKNAHKIDFNTLV